MLPTGAQQAKTNSEWSTADVPESTPRKNEEKSKRDKFSESESWVLGVVQAGESAYFNLWMCFQLVFILMRNISRSKLGSNSLNAAPQCCWRKGTCATQILEQQLIREGKTLLLLQLMAWTGNSQANRDMHTHTHSLSLTHTHTHTHTHTVNMWQISVSLSTV